MSVVADLVLRDAPKLKGDWNGKRIVTLRQLETGSFSVPEGKLGKIEWHRQGKTMLIFDPCGCCGVASRARVDKGHGTAFAFVADEPLL